MIMWNDSVVIKKNEKKYNEFTLKMVLTRGKIEAIINALEDYNTPVAKDVLLMIKEAYAKV